MRVALTKMMVPWAAVIAALDALNPAVSAAAVSGAFMLANTALIWWLTRERHRRDGAGNDSNQ